MRRLFVESASFSKKVDKAAAETLRRIQEELLERLEAGEFIPGTGGLQKIRVGDAGRGKGKRGGFRVIYLDLPSRETTYLLYVYDKGERTDISNDEKTILRGLAARLKGGAR
jgi:mRNA-degrading endonuclease RelE of RelBE toxin-antitoxin system